MQVTAFKIDGLKLLKPRVFSDERGYFFESYNKNTIASAGIDCEFIQDNQSYSEFGTLRGLHLQIGDSAQAKLVRVTKGEVLDVAVDLRPGSATFGQWESVVLSAENHCQFFVPRGFAHGFVVLSENALFQYKCDNYYDKSAESGVLYNDSELNIDWGIDPEKILLSDKDKVLGSFKDFKAAL